MAGVFGKYLKIDASTQSYQEVGIPRDIHRAFLGGVGLGTWILLKESTQGFDPLSPQAPIVFSLSPLVGTSLTTSAKFAVVAKSPLTHRICDALSSSHFAIEAKKTGFDALVIVGKCEKPSFLVVDSGEVSFRDASDLKGLSAQEASERIINQVGVGFQVSAIGIAGENQVLFANLSHEKRHAGRGGLGAVLGAKNIKAIAVRGGKRVRVAMPDLVVQISRDLSRKSFGPATEKYRTLGTMANLLVFNRLSVLPSRNFQSGNVADPIEFQDSQFALQAAMVRHSCAACTIGCERLVEGDHGKVRVEYESMFALGPLCGISDARQTVRAIEFCDCMGMDTISAGATVAFAMECVEKGLLDEPWLKFGDGEVLLKALEMTANRCGVGELLAQGSRQMALALGGNSIQFAPQVKGLEMPGYEPRGLQTMALGLAVATRGADHNRSGAYEADFSASSNRFEVNADSASRAMETEDRAAVIDSMILCKFLRGVFEDFYAESATMVSAVTGWEIGAGEMRQAAKRIVALKKLFNIREGWSFFEDTLPERFFQESAGGKAVLSKSSLESAIQEYYRLRGWSPMGMVPDSQLKELGLDRWLEDIGCE